MEHKYSNGTYQLTLPRLKLRAKRGMGEHAPRAALSIAVPSRLHRTPFLKERHKRHNGHALRSRRRIKRIHFGIHNHFFDLVLVGGRAERD